MSNLVTDAPDLGVSVDWELRQHRLLIQGLCDFTKHCDRTWNERVTELLELGLACFSADLATLSRVNDGTCTVTNLASMRGFHDLKGCQRPLVESFGSYVWNSADVCTFDLREPNSPYLLESTLTGKKLAGEALVDKEYGAVKEYLGAPIIVGKTPTALLEFFRFHHYPKGFGEVDSDALRLISGWMGSEMTRIEQELVLRRVNHRLMRQALTDPLTGLANRRAMFSHLRREANRLCREHREGCIALIDIDFFKRFNDTYGHQQGDIALRIVSKSMKQVLRDFDFLARYGGEEFLLWLPEQSLPAALSVCERIKEKVGSITLLPEPLTVSIGVATLSLTTNKDVSRDIDRAIAAADHLLFKAKKEGRNCVRPINFS